MSRVRTVDAPLDEILGCLVFLLGWNGGRLPVYLDGGSSPATVLSGGVSKLARQLQQRAARWDLEESRQVELGVPRLADGSVSALWATTDTRESAMRAHRFRPAPSMVLRFGASARRLIIWGLSEPVPGMLAEHGNKKIAYALHAPYRMVDPDKLRVPLPGTFLRVGRVRPAPVLVTLLEPAATYQRSQITARLKDPPRPFMERLRNGEVGRG